MAALSGGFGAYGGLAWNIGVNAIGGATGTAINNAVYGKNDSVIGAGVTSGGLSVVGYSTGKLAESWINSSLRREVDGILFDQIQWERLAGSSEAALLKSR